MKIKYTCLETSAVLKWLIASAGRSFSTAVPEQLRLLPLLFKVKHSFNHSFIATSIVTTRFKLFPLDVYSTMTLAHTFTHLLPRLQIAPVENDDSYDELKRDAKTCLSLMSQGLLYPDQIPMVLSALQEVSHLATGAVIPLLTCITRVGTTSSFNP